MLKELNALMSEQWKCERSLAAVVALPGVEADVRTRLKDAGHRAENRFGSLQLINVLSRLDTREAAFALHVTHVNDEPRHVIRLNKQGVGAVLNARVRVVQLTVLSEDYSTKINTHTHTNKQQKKQTNLGVYLLNCDATWENTVSEKLWENRLKKV